MLDYQLSVTVRDQLWDSATAQVVVPQSNEEFFDKFGALPTSDDSRRQYRRVCARGRAIALHQNNRYGIYTKDISPRGIGFFSPVPFLPKQLVTLVFEESDQIVLVIRRCVRTEQQTYSCGGNFQSGPLSPGEYRNFLAELKS